MVAERPLLLPQNKGKNESNNKGEAQIICKVRCRAEEI